MSLALSGWGLESLADREMDLLALVLRHEPFAVDASHMWQKEKQDDSSW